MKFFKSELVRKRKKEELLKILKKDPNDLNAIRHMIRVFRREGNIEGQREYLYRRLALEPNNPKTVVHLIKIEVDRGNSVQSRILIDKLGEMYLSSERQIREAIAIANNNQNYLGVKILADRLSQYRELAEKSIEDTERQNLEIEMLMTEELKAEAETPIQKARRLIYESEDLVKGAEEIQLLLQGQNEIDVALVLAELYFHTGMRERAEKHLKAYKKSLVDTDTDGIRTINGALELVRNSKTLPYKWREMWNVKEQNEKNSGKQSIKTQSFPSSQGGEDGEMEI